MKTYRHTQRANYILIALGVTAAALAIAGGLFLRPVLIIVPLLLLSGWLFHSLTVEITNDELRLAFGPGLIRKRVPLSEITASQLVRTSWIEGWGIHYTRYGWLYNVSGFDAVAITLKNGKQLCVGTDEPEKLRGHLQA